MAFESAYNGSPTIGTASLTDAVVETFVRWPIRMTGATMEFVIDGVQRMAATGARARGARHGHCRKPESWLERDYPVESAKDAIAHEISSSTPRPSHRDGWRVPSEDQKFIVFLYNVERRLPRQEEVVHTERVVVERDTRIA